MLPPGVYGPAAVCRLEGVMARDEDMKPEDPANHEAEQLLSEYLRIRQEYNSLDRSNPEHAERRAELRERYYELDRKYSTLVGPHDEDGEARGGDSPSKGEVLWRGAFDGEAVSLGTLDDDSEWVEIQTPVEGEDSTDALFERALEELEQHRPLVQDGDEEGAPSGTTLEGTSSQGGSGQRRPNREERLPTLDESAEAVEPEEIDESLFEGVRGESLEAITDQLESEGALDASAEDEGALAEWSPGRKSPGKGVTKRAREVAGAKESDVRGETIRPIACPACGETLPAGTQECTYCHARLIDDESSAAAERIPAHFAFETAKREERPGLGPKTVITLGWGIVFIGACWLIALGTGLGEAELARWLDSAHLGILAEDQASFIFGLAVLFLGGTLVGIGVFAGRFVRLVVPMHELARTGRVDMLEKMILKGENIDERDERGCTPLHFAVVAGQREAVAVLIGNGADINAHNDRGDTPLHMATANRDEALVRYLMGKGADPQAVNESGSTLMHVAAWVGDVALMTLFLGKGAALEPRTNVGFTPLHFAAQSGYVDTVEFLLGRGADPNAKSDLGTTPLFPAARNGHLPVVQRLVEAGADVNVKRGHDFESPLGIAAAGKRREIVEYLKARGAAT